LGLAALRRGHNGLPGRKVAYHHGVIQADFWRMALLKRSALVAYPQHCLSASKDCFQPINTAVFKAFSLGGILPSAMLRSACIVVATTIFN
jgi:hypothetical protein